MKWFRAKIYERVETGRDATNNPVYELQATDKAILVRTAPQEPSRDDTEGNRFDLVNRTFLTKAKMSLLENAAAIEVGGILYSLESVSAWDAPIALKVKRTLKQGD